MAVPRIRPPAGSSGVGLPQPLPPSEAARIRRIFAFQRRNDIPAAIAETASLSDDTLLGHILADRYFAQAAGPKGGKSGKTPVVPGRATAPELSEWLGRYADLPDAPAIYALLLRALPKSVPVPAPPSGATLASSPKPGPHGFSDSSPAARDAFLRGKDAAAQRLGREAWERSGGRGGQAAYVAGLAAWRRTRFAEASVLFAHASQSTGASPALAAAGAYWTARAELRAGAEDRWRPWMVRAAGLPQTLHGMLATRALGLAVSPPPSNPTLAQADIDAVMALGQGRRAFALLQVGQSARAEAEFRRMWPTAQGDASLVRALYLVACTAGLPDLANDLAAHVDAVGAVLPVPSLHPRGGFTLNAALVYAVAHVESNFDAGAVSGAGAHGLMQLMPIAASAVGRNAATPRLLRDPAMNLKIGQDYLAYLSKAAVAGDDLLRVLASYNSGPAAVQRWVHDAEDDPLLFLETIPNDETRAFVQHTLLDLWSYTARFRLPAPSLDAMASGEWPHFSPEIMQRRPQTAQLH